MLSITLAAGAVIAAIYNALVTNALKPGLKALGNGLKEIGKKLPSLLPGILGEIVSFLFKTAASVISFLAENAWLLILAVVALLIEGYTKKKNKLVVYLYLRAEKYTTAAIAVAPTMIIALFVS